MKGTANMQHTLLEPPVHCAAVRHVLLLMLVLLLLLQTVRRQFMICFESIMSEKVVKKETSRRHKQNRWIIPPDHQFFLSKLHKHISELSSHIVYPCDFSCPSGCEQPTQLNCCTPIPMQQYARAAKELLDNVAKLTIRQDAGQQPARTPGPVLLQASAVPAQAPSSSRPTVPIEARISRFKQELLASRINLDELRRLAFQGIPDKDGLRAMTWKVCGQGRQSKQHLQSLSTLSVLCASG